MTVTTIFFLVFTNFIAYLSIYMYIYIKELRDEN